MGTFRKLLIRSAFFVASWGPLNLDADAMEFPAPFNSRDDAQAIATPPQTALDSIELKAGFRSTLFAAEPDVQNPIAMAWDDRGRLWIAENYTYAESRTRFEMGLRDRIIILEDDDGDGVFDHRKVFTDQVQMLTSLEIGHGGVWIMTPPHLQFIPDANGDDVPEGPPQIKLDGFTVAQANYHNFANGLKWGPDGWLYGRCGGSCPGLIGTSSEMRVPLRGGMWRYHPIKKRVEVLNTGTTNPWGHDWTALGECFFVNTVNGHLWHSIAGGHYVSNGRSDPNPRVYQMIDQHADHWHFDTGTHWTKSRDGAANSYGGGHAHSGAMIYLGENWPAEYRGNLFTVNLHGRRLNQEILERSESGFVAKHGDDLLETSDPWYRGIDLSYGPDGGVFLLDWSDTGECHESTGVHRTSGRIFKVTYGKMPPADPLNLRAEPDSKLVKLHLSTNEWFIRQARLILGERSAAQQLEPETIKELTTLFLQSPNLEQRIRSLLTLHQVGGCSSTLLAELLESKQEIDRVWALRLLTDDWPLDGPLGPIDLEESERTRVMQEAKKLLPTLVELARNDPSAFVRLTLASTLQRLPVSLRAELARGLVTRQEDAGDHNLPLLVWYGLIPVVDVDAESILPVVAACQWPITRSFIARRLTEDLEKNPGPLGKLITFTASQSDDFRVDILNGISEAVKGRKRAVPPATWTAATAVMKRSPNAQVRERVRQLNLLFGDPQALEELQQIAFDDNALQSERQAALTHLIDARPANLKQICQRLLKDRNFSLTAASGLALFDDVQIGEDLLQICIESKDDERSQMVSVLTTRPSFAKLLLNAIEKGEIPRSDLTSFHVRQIRSMKSPELDAQVLHVWGQLRETPEEKLKRIQELKRLLGDEKLGNPDLSNGRKLFQSICSKCHRIYGEGGAIAPDLTGSNRKNLDYLLENIVDPSAVVSKDYRLSVIAMNDGRILNGVIVSQTETTLTLQSLQERFSLEKEAIEELQTTELSPMPEGQIDPLTHEQIRDLIGYLQHSEQVPLPESDSNE
ncbi:PVC-type heme-binding CxxCH protein [Planctomicrobium sp. SH668]|uniref:PVC-type heme-binding CxxCH protein n=1 Tax=Planctomicrobium sp. SH668 TaxID=3448126 RepID=UPI003F5BBD49